MNKPNNGNTSCFLNGFDFLDIKCTIPVISSINGITEIRIGFVHGSGRIAINQTNKSRTDRAAMIDWNQSKRASHDDSI